MSDFIEQGSTSISGFGGARPDVCGIGESDGTGYGCYFHGDSGNGMPMGSILPLDWGGCNTVSCGVGDGKGTEYGTGMDSVRFWKGMNK